MCRRLALKPVIELEPCPAKHPRNQTTAVCSTPSVVRTTAVYQDNDETVFMNSLVISFQMNHGMEWKSLENKTWQNSNMAKSCVTFSLRCAFPRSYPNRFRCLFGSEVSRETIGCSQLMMSLFIKLVEILGKWTVKVMKRPPIGNTWSCTRGCSWKTSTRPRRSKLAQTGIYISNRVPHLTGKLT